MPKRVRGIVLGLATLLVGPVVSAALFAPAGPAAVASHSSGAAAVQVVRERVTHVHELDFAPDPTAAPPALVVHLTATTPKPTPAAPGPIPGVSYAPGTVAAIIMAAAAAHGVDGNWMVSIAHCESGLRPNAYNPAGPYVGLYQFLPSTFAAHGGTNIYDPTQQANIAAAMLAAGGARSWPVCSRQ
jgi:soluble lytic murein transglycosylase-like protein